MDMKALEKALAYSKVVPDAIALVVLKDAVERFLGAQSKAQPVAPKSEPSKQDTFKWPEGLSDLVKRSPTRSGGCPACGCPDGVPHFCTGRRIGGGNTGIEYWMNQPHAMGIATNGQRVGGIGTSVGSAQG